MIFHFLFSLLSFLHLRNHMMSLMKQNEVFLTLLLLLTPAFDLVPIFEATIESTERKHKTSLSGTSGKLLLRNHNYTCRFLSLISCQTLSQDILWISSRSRIIQTVLRKEIKEVLVCHCPNFLSIRDSCSLVSTSSCFKLQIKNHRLDAE